MKGHSEFHDNSVSRYSMHQRKDCHILQAVLPAPYVYALTAQWVTEINEPRTPATIHENQKESHCTLKRNRYQLSQPKSPSTEFKLMGFKDTTEERWERKRSHIQLYKNFS